MTRVIVTLADSSVFQWTILKADQDPESNLFAMRQQSPGDETDDEQGAVAAT